MSKETNGQEQSALAATHGSASRPYETILTNGMSATIPTKPCICLHRIKNVEGWPFVMTVVRKKWWLFGELVIGSFTLLGKKSPVSHWQDPECWRTPNDQALRPAE